MDCLRQASDFQVTLEREFRRAKPDAMYHAATNKYDSFKNLLIF